MESAVCFRDFEERDIDFVYKCKNNEKLWEYTVGDFHKFSYEEAVEWVHGCMRDDPTYKFWAICKNDETRDIVGWCSIANIDYLNRSVEGYGTVIGSQEYRDGFTWIEAILFLLHYVFETMQFDKIYTCFLSDYFVGKLYLAFLNVDRIEKNAIKKDGKYHDITYISITKEQYFANADLMNENI